MIHSKWPILVKEMVKVKKTRVKRDGDGTLEVRKAKKGKRTKSSKKVGVVEKTDDKLKKVTKKLSDGKLNGLGSGDHVRSAVLVRNNLIACMRPTGLSRDCAAVEICHHSSEKSLVMCSLYVENGKFPKSMLAKIGACPWMKSGRVIIGCDANARHKLWNAKANNKRGELMMDWISDSGLVVINKQGHGATWRRKHLDGMR